MHAGEVAREQIKHQWNRGDEAIKSFIGTWFQMSNDEVDTCIRPSALARVSSNYFKICITRPSRAPACPPEFLKIQNSSALREPKFVASSTLASDSFFVMSIDRCLVVYVDRYFPSGLMETLENSCFFHGKATSSITGSLSIGASNSLSIVASDFSSIDASVECRSMLQSPIPIQLHGRSNKLQ
ncbi:hypothetical protein F2Q70_00026019 [Brassica cretica]|uniref:Uncharacterized protein n=1 Tax=Brassica cretica TaxID=69181 RepID=A0A8S9LK39_BRACR|nr:hypothetical protein F2Q70_00026019 [Brassica cretica]